MLGEERVQNGLREPLYFGLANRRCRRGAWLAVDKCYLPELLAASKDGEQFRLSPIVCFAIETRPLDRINRPRLGSPSRMIT